MLLYSHNKILVGTCSVLAEGDGFGPALTEGVGIGEGSIQMLDLAR
jgi:hypothetical protein